MINNTAHLFKNKINFNAKINIFIENIYTCLNIIITLLRYKTKVNKDKRKIVGYIVR